MCVWFGFLITIFLSHAVSSYMLQVTSFYIPYLEVSLLHHLLPDLKSGLGQHYLRFSSASEYWNTLTKVWGFLWQVPSLLCRLCLTEQIPALLAHSGFGCHIVLHAAVACVEGGWICRWESTAMNRRERAGIRAQGLIELRAASWTGDQWRDTPQ